MGGDGSLCLFLTQDRASPPYNQSALNKFHLFIYKFSHTPYFCFVQDHQIPGKNKRQLLYQSAGKQHKALRIAERSGVQASMKMNVNEGSAENKKKTKRKAYLKFQIAGGQISTTLQHKIKYNCVIKLNCSSIRYLIIQFFFFSP